MPKDHIKYSLFYITDFFRLLNKFKIANTFPNYEIDFIQVSRKWRFPQRNLCVALTIYDISVNDLS